MLLLFCCVYFVCTACTLTLSAVATEPRYQQVLWKNILCRLYAMQLRFELICDKFYFQNARHRE